MSGSKLLPWVSLRGFQRQADALTTEVNVQYLNFYFVAHGNYCTGVVYVLPRKFRHMDQTVHAAQVYEGTKVDHAGDNSLTVFPRTQVMQELFALFFVALFKPSTTRKHYVVAVFVQLDDLGFYGLANVGLQVTYSTQLHQRGG